MTLGRIWVQSGVEDGGEGASISGTSLEVLNLLCTCLDLPVSRLVSMVHMGVNYILYPFRCGEGRHELLDHGQRQRGGDVEYTIKGYREIDRP